MRASGSGLGCGEDWPKCDGRWMPVGYHGWIEWLHRASALGVIFLTVALAISAFPARRIHRNLWRMAVTTVPVVFSQAIIGAIVVKRDLEAEAVVLHLLVAMALLGVLVSMLVAMAIPENRSATAVADFSMATSSRPTLWVAIGSLGVMLLGSLTSGKAGGLAVGGWPLVDGGVFPEKTTLPAVLHYTHRLGAAVGAVAVCWLARRLWKQSPDHRATRFAVAGCIAYLAQIILGGINALTELATPVRAAHLSLGALVWILLFASSRLRETS